MKPNMYLIFGLIIVVFISGCTQKSSEQLDDITNNISVVAVEQSSIISENSNTTQIQNPEVQGRRDQKLEGQSRRLLEIGIDCTHENTYGTRNSLAKDNQKLLMVTSDITSAYIDWPYGETGGIWESLDGGESWRQMIKGNINVAGSGNLAIDPKNNKIMYYPVNPDIPTFEEAPIKESLNKKGSVYKTTDGGISWEELKMPMLPSLQAVVIAIDPENSNHLLFFTQSHDHIYGESSITEVFLHQQHGILESFDGGKTWVAIGDTLPDPYRTLFDGDVSKNNFKHIIVRPFLFGDEFPPETTQQKSFFSTDGGKKFEQTSAFIWTGRYDPHDTEGKHLLGYAPWQGWVVESKDAGKTWGSISSPEEVSSYKVKISNFVWDPINPNLVYMSGDYANIWQSFDGGKTWINILNMEKLPK